MFLRTRMGIARPLHQPRHHVNRSDCERAKCPERGDHSRVESGGKAEGPQRRRQVIAKPEGKPGDEEGQTQHKRHPGPKDETRKRPDAKRQYNLLDRVRQHPLIDLGAGSIGKARPVDYLDRKSVV